MIRSRSKDDLSRLCKKLHGYCDESQILETKRADYRYRMKIKKQMWSEYLANSAFGINYPIVKDNIIPDRNDLRKDAYYQVWTALYRWQSMMSDKQP